MLIKMLNKTNLINLPLVDYDEGLEIQKKLETLRKNGQIADSFLMLQHYPVYTLGRSGQMDNLLLDQEKLEEQGVKIRHIRRGGDITFHGPGQIVGYPIINIKELGIDAHQYLRSLEQMLLDTLKELSLEPYTIEGMTGVWVNGAKIAAIGVGLSNWVTTHGFALNLNTDISFFEGIIPCGLKGKKATSINIQAGRLVEEKDVREILARNFSDLFKVQLIEKELEQLINN